MIEEEVNIKIIELQDLRNFSEKKVERIEEFAKEDLSKIYPNSLIYICSQLKSLISNGNKTIIKEFFSKLEDYHDNKEKDILDLLWKVGCPDIIKFNLYKKEIIFFEIKSEKDSLRHEQIKWIKEAEKLGIPSYVIHYKKPKKKLYKYIELKKKKQKINSKEKLMKYSNFLRMEKYLNKLIIENNTQKEKIIAQDIEINRLKSLLTIKNIIEQER
ncbi:MAG: VRR-NUC domain-containing protein [Candidatus Pacearchaeota archaeon]|jgi:L-rhamnose mutarotase